MQEACNYCQLVKRATKNENAGSLQLLSTGKACDKNENVGSLQLLSTGKACDKNENAEMN